MIYIHIYLEYTECLSLTCKGYLQSCIYFSKSQVLQNYDKSNLKIQSESLHLLMCTHTISCLAPSLPSVPGQVWWGPGSLGSVCPLPCVLFSTDPCWRSRDQGLRAEVLKKGRSVCEEGGRWPLLEAMGEQRATVWQLNVSHASLSFPAIHHSTPPSWSCPEWHGWITEMCSGTGCPAADPVCSSQTMDRVYVSVCTCVWDRKRRRESFIYAESFIYSFMPAWSVY